MWMCKRPLWWTIRMSWVFPCWATVTFYEDKISQMCEQNQAKSSFILIYSKHLQWVIVHWGNSIRYVFEKYFTLFSAMQLQHSPYFVWNAIYLDSVKCHFIHTFIKLNCAFNNWENSFNTIIQPILKITTFSHFQGIKSSLCPCQLTGNSWSYYWSMYSS